MTEQLTAEPFVGTREVAAFLGKPVSYVYEHAGRLGIPRYKLGNQWRYLLSEVEDWLRGHQCAA